MIDTRTKEALQAENKQLFMLATDSEWRIVQLRALNAEILAALNDLVSDCEEYVRINNLHNADGSPATNHAMRRARAAIAKAEGRS